MRLTIGIIARNGLPHLHHCLTATAEVMNAVPGLEAILVDCCSHDQTLEAMRTFARSVRAVRVFTITGQANAACARNTILQHARPGAVFLVDGDVAINRAFVEAGLGEINAGTADVVIGQLPEVLYDDQRCAIGQRGDRYGIRDRRSVGVFGGLSILSGAVVERRYRFDETLRVGEDTDFAIRVADEFRIVALPIPMGTHHTTDYFHGRRARAYVRDLYVRPKGTLLRKHLLHPLRLWRARKSFSGMIVGGTLQATFIGLAILGPWESLLVPAAAACADFVNNWRRHKLAAYLQRRFLAPWILFYGLLCQERFAANYSVQAIEPRDDPVPSADVESA